MPVRVRIHVGVTLRREPGAQVHVAQLLAHDTAEVGERDKSAVAEVGDAELLKHRPKRDGVEAEEKRRQLWRKLKL